MVTALVLFRRQAAEQSLRAKADLLADALEGLLALPRSLTGPGRSAPCSWSRVLVAVCRGDIDPLTVLGRLDAPLADRVVLAGTHRGDVVLLLRHQNASGRRRAGCDYRSVAASKEPGSPSGSLALAAWGDALVAAHRRALRVVGTLRLYGPAKAPRPTTSVSPVWSAPTTWTSRCTSRTP